MPFCFDLENKCLVGRVLPGETRVLGSTSATTSLISHEAPPVSGALGVIGVSGGARWTGEKYERLLRSVDTVASGDLRRLRNQGNVEIAAVGRHSRLWRPKADSQ